MASFDFKSINSDVLGLAFAVVMAAAQKFWRGYQDRRAETWPISYGRIDRISVDTEHKRVKFKCYYTYRVGTESFVGSFEKTFEDRDEAYAWQDALQKKQVAVRYDPDKPGRSQLRESDLEPIVQAAAPAFQIEMGNQASGIRVFAAKVCFVVCAVGLAITLSMIIEEYSGIELVPPRIASITGWAAVPVFFLGTWIGGKDKLSAKMPGWMKFLGYALLYYALFAAFLSPARHSKNQHAVWDPRYELFLYFSALEACYLRLHHSDRTSQTGDAALSGPSLKS